MTTTLLCCCWGSLVFACECGPAGPASQYVKQASLVFVGKVVFTNDDGSGQFIQHTLVHFEVEESFKGLDASVHDVWIDPGSWSSCYCEYKVGERYLVFAYGGSELPKDTAAMSTANGGCRTKTLPAGIDPKNPPKVYSAAECSGTSGIVAESEAAVAREVKWLRKNKAQAKPAS